MKAIFFDLDETLYDHRHACATGIQTIRERYAELQQRSVEQLELHFWTLLNRMYLDVLHGRVSQEASRRERIRALFAVCGAEMAAEVIDEAVAAYSQAYHVSRRAIPGAIEVLTWLREAGCTIAIVTNGMTAVQQDKLDVCGLLPYADMLITADEVGCTKPERAMFQAALDRCGVTAQQALMIGDSWHSDVVGARAAGIQAIWLNRRGERCPEPESVPEITELSELRQLLPEMIRFQLRGANGNEH